MLKKSLLIGLLAVGAVSSVEASDLGTQFAFLSLGGGAVAALGGVGKMCAKGNFSGKAPVVAAAGLVALTGGISKIVDSFVSRSLEMSIACSSWYSLFASVPVTAYHGYKALRARDNEERKARLKKVRFSGGVALAGGLLGIGLQQLASRG